MYSNAPFIQRQNLLLKLCKTTFLLETKRKKKESIKLQGGYYIASVAIGLIPLFPQDHEYL